MCLRFREIDSHDSSDLSEPFGLKEKFGDVDSSGQRKQPNCRMKQLQNQLAGGFKHFLFSPLFGEDSHFDKFF